MKRLLCLLIALLLPCCACAENLPEIILLSPTPSAAPAGEEFSCEAFIVRLPARLSPIPDGELTGYEAALQASYPLAAETQLLAADEALTAAACFALTESDLSVLEAAQEAAENILGSGESASELSFGENSGAGFACAADDTVYHIYFFSNGSQLLCVTACGLAEDEIHSMLASLDF